MMYAPGAGRFTCPKCGSCYFRSDIANAVGFCKGLWVVDSPGAGFYTGCSFSWPRGEDEKYFERVRKDGES